MEKTEINQVKKLIGLINFYPFNEVKIETKLRMSKDGASSLFIIEQTEFLNKDGENFTELDSRKIIIDKSQSEDFAELWRLGLTFINKEI